MVTNAVKGGLTLWNGALVGLPSRRPASPYGEERVKDAGSYVSNSAMERGSAKAPTCNSGVH